MEPELDHTMLEAVLVDGGPENYKKWSKDFEKYCVLVNYLGPKHVVAKWQSYNTKLLDPTKSMQHIRIFDAGCGTGLVGEDMQSTLVSRELSTKVEIYGGDFCKAMLDIAKTKSLYSDLRLINLKEELPYDTKFFDGIVSSGTFCHGHCGPECLPELARVLKRNGYLVATVNKQFYLVTMDEWKKKIHDCSCRL